MNYPEEMCAPMRADLTSVGFMELKTAEEVVALLEKKEGVILLIVNSVCGCAAGNARPAAKIATTFSKKADVFATVFAIITISMFMVVSILTMLTMPVTTTMSVKPKY